MSKRTKTQDDWHKRGFAVGTCVAAGIIMSCWGEEVEAEEILRSAHLDTRAKCKALGVDDYDLDILKPVFATIRRKRQGMKKAMHDNCGLRRISE